VIVKGAMVTQLMGGYKILNTDEGAVECASALTEVLFPQIYETIFDSFCESVKIAFFQCKLRKISSKQRIPHIVAK
jgi:hypothetical protein